MTMTMTLRFMSEEIRERQMRFTNSRAPYVMGKVVKVLFTLRIQRNL